MRKLLVFFTAAMMMATGLCTFGSETSEAAAGDDKIQIVTTIFPVYDWVMNVLGENPADAEVTMLLDSGVDLHSFQPTAEDILKISTCDLFLYVGGESDQWVKDALQEATNKDMIVVSLLDALGDSAKEEEVVEGMQEEAHERDHEHEEDADADAEDHEHEEAGDADAEDHEHEEDADADAEDHEHEEAGDADAEEHEHEHEEGEAEFDEHVWLSLRNAAVLAQSIADCVQSIDPDNVEIYESNTAAYIEKLNTLDEKYKEAIGNASFHTLLFGDRFPFRYLTDDYGLEYFAAFVGCSAETEASFETIMFLAQKVDELGLPAVMTIEGTDHRIAETIVQSTKTRDQQILALDSMQSTTAGDVENGSTYLDIMEKNLSVLTEALK